MKEKHFEVIVVGGSYAGLSAAMSLGRSLRKTLIIDSGKPCNRFTPHSHNFLTQDGKEPGRITADARFQVESYPTVQILNDLVTAGHKNSNVFEIETKNGHIFQAGKLVFATGIKDIFPAIEGFEACWGKSIIHCPYCHGYEFRGKKTAIWVNPENSLHLAPLIRNLTSQVTLLTDAIFHFTLEERKKIENNGIAIIESRITGITHNNGQLQEVIFEDDTREQFDVLYAGLPFEQHCTIPEALGCELTDKGYIKTDMFFKTTVNGIYACGDNVSPFRSVANAVANGNFTGAAINRELAIERFETGYSLR